MNWYPQACPVCGGDLHDDLEDKGWATCFMCARSFIAQELLAVQRATRQPSEARPEVPKAA